MNAPWDRSIQAVPVPWRDRAYNGGDVAMHWRFKGSGLVSGGLSLGKSVTNTCFANAHPQITGNISAGSVTALGVRSDKYCNNDAQSLWNGIGSQVKY